MSVVPVNESGDYNVSLCNNGAQVAYQQVMFNLTWIAVSAQTCTFKHQTKSETWWKPLTPLSSTVCSVHRSHPYPQHTRLTSSDSRLTDMWNDGTMWILACPRLVNISTERLTHTKDSRSGQETVHPTSAWPYFIVYGHIHPLLSLAVSFEYKSFKCRRMNISLRKSRVDPFDSEWVLPEGISLS